VSLENPFAMHRQSFWEEQAATLPLAWQRLGAIAFATHKGNGHANFKSGELGMMLGKPGPEGWEALSPQHVSNLISTAKKAGWLAAESSSRCLVVPHHAIQGGLGSANEKCAVHHGKRRRGSGISR
jgi:hypothetical protein